MGILSLLLLTGYLAAAAPATEIYSYLYAGKTIHARVGEMDGLKMNDLCLREPKKCAALKAHKGASRFQQLKNVRQGNFAGAYCELLGGSQLFARKEKEPETQFCVFSDLTFIDAQALYRRHSGKAGK